MPMNRKILPETLASLDLTLAVAESCTGGLIADTITNIPGASSFFAGGIIAYANTAKTTLLNVPPALIKAHGAVSGPVAMAMAKGARQRFNTSLAIATTGIAGPAGGTTQKPVGLVFIALASDKGVTLQRCQFKGTRRSVKNQACRAALNLITAHVK
jgi:nicotinamide-nucleotide amidase